MPDGRPVGAFRLTNVGGITVRILELGGIIQSVRTPDRDGCLGEIVLGYGDVAGYLNDTAYTGAQIGRFAGRIDRGEIEIDGVTYPLSVNSGRTTLHGGAVGFDRAIWRGSIDGERVTLRHTSPDGDQGFPGELAIEVVFELGDDDELRLSYRATTTRPTVINFTGHAYWNLAGHGLVSEHTLTVEADAVLETNSNLIPTGGFSSVAGTPLDLREPRRLGEAIEAMGGLDHTYVLAGNSAQLKDPVSGRTLRVRSDEPGLTVYTGNAFAGAHPRWSGVALEPEHFPDSPHHAHFPSTVLRPGEEYRSSTIYRFGVARDRADQARRLSCSTRITSSCRTRSIR